jgi:hypothetical protein
MTAEMVKRAATETWRSSILGFEIMLAASLLWSVVSVLVLVSVNILHAENVTKAILISFLTVIPGSVLVGALLGYWIATAQPSPIGAASLAGVAAVTINPLLVAFVAILLGTAPHGWVVATLSGAILYLTAAPFWFLGALVLYGLVERRLLGGTRYGGSRTALLPQLIRFCLNPSIPVTRVDNPLSWGCCLLGYNLFLSLFLLLLVVPVMKYLGASYIAHPRRLWLWIIFSAVIEELTFRLPLNASPINLSISALLFALFPVGSLLLKFGSFGLATPTERWLWRAVFSILVASALFLLLRIEAVKRLTERIWIDHFRSVLYFSCFTFGLVHLFNYRFTSLTGTILFLAPLLVLPQIISGFILAFTRMRLGLIWSITLHAVHNLVLLSTIGRFTPRS